MGKKNRDRKHDSATDDPDEPEDVVLGAAPAAVVQPEPVAAPLLIQAVPESEQNGRQTAAPSEPEVEQELAPEPESAPESRAAKVERELRTPAAAGVAGILFTILFGLALALLYQRPPQGANAAQIAGWYLGNHAKTLGLVGLYVAPFAGITFLWFVAAVRDRIGAREDRFFATVFLASGILVVGMLFAAAASISAPIVAVKFQGAPPPSPDVFVFARGLGYTLLYVYGLRAAAVFMIVGSTIGLRTGTMPRWLALLGYVVAATLLLGVSFIRGIVFVFPAWVLIVSLEILWLTHKERRATQT